MSIRSRIEKFETLSKDEEANGDLKKKRFRHPGSSSEPDSQAVDFATRSPRKNGFHTQNYEADLQEVWSVRKNIHHTGGNKHPTSNSSFKGQGSHIKPGLYSRHGALPRGSVGNSTEQEQAAVHSKRTPLQDINSKESTWNVKKGGYSYNYRSSIDKIDTSKAAEVESPLLPAAKRKINGVAEVKATSFPLRMNTDQNEKVGYAKRMAQGYLRSVGMGEFTPNSDSYSKGSRSSSLCNTTNAGPSRWKKLDDDNEFDFDV